MTTSEPIGRPTRRSALAALSGVAAAASLSLPAVAAPLGQAATGQQFLEWELRLENIHVLEQFGLFETVMDDFFETWRLILHTPCSDLTGAAVKVRAVCHPIHGTWENGLRTDGSDSLALQQAAEVIAAAAGRGR